MTKEPATLLQKVMLLIDHCGANYPVSESAHVLMYAAATQTLHLSPDQSMELFTEARKNLINAGASNEAMD
jgi:hypothetical protein